MRILLINQYSGNKGDRAVLYAMCHILKSIYRDVEITVSTSEPELWNGYCLLYTSDAADEARV